MKKKKIAIIGTVGIPAAYGGFETLAEQLVRHLGKDFQLSVYCTGKVYKRGQRPKEYLGARLFYLPFSANGVWSVVYDSLSILHALIFADVLLVLGVSGGIMFPFVRWFTRKKLIVSIDGIEWKREKWNKAARGYLWWAEKMAVRYSHADIADNESIQDYTAYRYKTLSRIIEYGGDHTKPVKASPNTQKKYAFMSGPYAFKVCRIEPENNIRMILQAFTGIDKMPLVMVGNWNNSEYGRKLRAEFSSYRNIILLDPVYDQSALDFLRCNCSLYIHGHSAGGTNPSLVEAMYLGLPVAAFRVSYNKTTTENKAWFFSNGEELIQIVQTASKRNLQTKAAELKSIAQRRYKWEVITDKYSSLILDVLESNEKLDIQPSFRKIRAKELVDMQMGHLAYPSYFYEKR